jgi:hypothetical protein
MSTGLAHRRQPSPIRSRRMAFYFQKRRISAFRRRDHYGGVIVAGPALSAGTVTGVRFDGEFAEPKDSVPMFEAGG